MGIPSSLPTNPNPSPSPPLSQSLPLQTPPLPQSPPPQSPPLPPSQTPTLILPTPLSSQTEPQNETPIFDTQFPKPMPEPEPTQTKSKGKTKKAAGRPKKTPVRKWKRVPSVPFDLNSPPQPSSEPVSKRTRSSSQIPPPAVQTPVSQSPLSSPAAPVSSADNIEEVLSLLPWAFKDMDIKNAYEKLASKPILANKYMDEHILKELGIYDSVFAYLDAISWTKFARIREPVIASFTIQPSVASPDTTEILATLKSLEVKIDTMGQQQGLKQTLVQQQSLDSKA
ncbi:proline-rich receptor-like protein kinase PERK2 [Hevea brasiliensis]|uniref:proline-rich receptor-like protein kinase PERK2 n=1 Tax=Hevea brasiliensis TaxID=3981 RepID=UPI0025E91AE6|nr:proline-rich receptor-like protein kinase PERK2 [Hevea brasiliensis]